MRSRYRLPVDYWAELILGVQMENTKKLVVAATGAAILATGVSGVTTSAMAADDGNTAGVTSDSGKKAEKGIDSKQVFEEIATSTIIKNVNDARVKAGLNPLKVTKEMSEIADIRSHEIDKSYRHDNVATRLFEQNYQMVGENIWQWPGAYSIILGNWSNKVLGIGDLAYDSYMNSPTHRMNLMNSDYTHIAVATYIGDSGNISNVVVLAKYSDKVVKSGAITEIDAPEGYTINEDVSNLSGSELADAINSGKIKLAGQGTGSDTGESEAPAESEDPSDEPDDAPAEDTSGESDDAPAEDTLGEADESDDEDIDPDLGDVDNPEIIDDPSDGDEWIGDPDEDDDSDEEEDDWVDPAPHLDDGKNSFAKHRYDINNLSPDDVKDIVTDTGSEMPLTEYEEALYKKAKSMASEDAEVDEGTEDSNQSVEETLDEAPEEEGIDVTPVGNEVEGNSSESNSDPGTRERTVDGSGEDEEIVVPERYQDTSPELYKFLKSRYDIDNLSHEDMKAIARDTSSEGHLSNYEQDLYEASLAGLGIDDEDTVADAGNGGTWVR